MTNHTRSVLEWRPRSEASADGGNIPALPEPLVEQLAELWCEVLLENLRRHPIEPMQKAS